MRQHSWGSKTTLPVTCSKTTLGRSWATCLHTYILNDHYREKSDNLPRYVFNDHPWESQTTFQGMCQMSVPMIHHSREKSDNLPGYVLDHHSLGRWLTCPGMCSMASLRRSQTTCLDTCLKTTFGNVKQLAQVCAQLVSLMRYHSMEKSDNLPRYMLGAHFQVNLDNLPRYKLNESPQWDITPREDGQLAWVHAWYVPPDKTTLFAWVYAWWPLLGEVIQLSQVHAQWLLLGAVRQLAGFMLNECPQCNTILWRKSHNVPSYMLNTTLRTVRQLA